MTVLEADDPTDAGEALITPPFEGDASTQLMEIYHDDSAENLWDGGNVKVDGQVLAPLVSYPGVISVPGDRYAKVGNDNAVGTEHQTWSGVVGLDR